VKLHYVEDLFRDAPERAQFERLAERWYELSDFLVNVLKVESVPGRIEGELTYHDSCAGLREIGIKAQPRALLKQAGARIREMNECEKCCGFGGTFAVKLGDISTRMAANKCANIRATGARTIAGGDLGCLLNIEGRLRREGDHETRVAHFAELICPSTD
jgi:L-lactate dehydrogenase complex protein LldE